MESTYEQNVRFCISQLREFIATKDPINDARDIEFLEAMIRNFEATL